MKKGITICLILLVLIAGIVLINQKMGTKNNNKLNIMTSFYPVYIATLNITDGVDGVEVKNLTKNVTGCLHDYTLTTQEMVDINEADVLIINGAGMEGFMEDVINNYPKLDILDTSSGIELIENENDEEGKYNPHVFVSVLNYIIQVENIAKKLEEIDSVNKDKYELNKNNYISKLSKLDSEIKETSTKLKYNNIVSFHESLPYFAKEYNLNVVATIESEHGKMPSAGDLADLVKKVKEQNVKAIFVEPDYNAKIAETVAKETGLKVYIINPATSGENTKDAYVSIMKNNITVLKDALN